MSSELLKGGEDNEYQIVDKVNVFHRYVNTRSVNMAAYVAGIIEGSLTISGFDCKVSAHHQEPNSPTNAAVAKKKAAAQANASRNASSAIETLGLILLVKFDQRVMQRSA